MPTADELMELARACADQVELSDRRELPSLEDIEEQAGDTFEELLEVLQEDEIFGGVDLDRQQALVDSISKALAESERPLVEELTDQQTRQVWLMQEAAYHVGLAVGLRLAGARRDDPES